MKRREFISLLSVAAVWPLGARAQQPERRRRIGVLMGGAGRDPVEHAQLAAFLDGLQQLGWTDGRNESIATGPGAIAKPRPVFANSGYGFRPSRFALGRNDRGNT